MTWRSFISLFRLPANLRLYSTKILAEIDPAVMKQLQKSSFRKSPGLTIPPKPLRLPADIEHAIQVALKEENYDALIKNGYAFLRQLHGRHAPLEEYEKELLVQAEELKIKQKLLDKKKNLDPEEFSKYKKKSSQVLLHNIKVKENLWSPTKYDVQKCFQYLLLRGPADYAVVKVILSEIAQRDPDFKPRSILDFGSGVGTVSWVIEELWKSCQEFYNVDLCSTMRDLAGLILKRGNPQKQLNPGVFFKGFLPSSLKHTHDIVVSAYTLLELPSRRHRLETLLTLWNKTDGYLVIVEEGTRAGYKIVIEARDFVLEMAEREHKHKWDVGTEDLTGAHVFSPCAHDRACPKMLTSIYPCNFQVTYSQHPCVQSTQVVRERYSYVVLKRGVRPADKTSWPRIVEEMKIRKRHIICRLCTADGSLSHITLGAKKNDDGTYTVLKSSVWGDRLPFVLREYEEDKLSTTEQRRLNALEKRRRATTDKEEDSFTSQQRSDEALDKEENSFVSEKMSGESSNGALNKEENSCVSENMSGESSDGALNSKSETINLKKCGEKHTM